MKPNTARRARRLLRAWTTGDLAVLEQHLDAELTVPDAADTNSVEAERGILLKSVAQEMRNSIRQVRKEDANNLTVALMLLHHLTHVPPRRVQTRCES